MAKPPASTTSWKIKIAPLYARPSAWARMQQHCIGINGTFFNTHRMLGQYFLNAYFPQMPEEEAIPVAVDQFAKERRSGGRRAADKAETSKALV